MKKTSPVLRAAETVMRVLLTACGLAAVGFVIVITGYLVVSGIPAIREVGLIEFLAGTVWKPSTDQFGILPVILTSVLGTFGAILIGVPLGLLFAIYLGKMAPKPVYQVLRPTVDLLSGIPSVVYGLVGMMVLVPFVREAFHVADGVGLDYRADGHGAALDHQRVGNGAEGGSARIRGGEPRARRHVERNGV